MNAASTPSTRTTGAKRAPGSPGRRAAVDPSTAVRLDREPHDVRADRRVGVGLPGQGVGPGANVASLVQRTLLVPIPIRTASSRTRARRSRLKCTAAAIASLDTWSDRHEQRPVAGEPLRGTPDGQRGDRRRSRTPGERNARNGTESGEAPEGSAQQPPPRERPEHASIGSPGSGGPAVSEEDSPPESSSRAFTCPLRARSCDRRGGRRSPGVRGCAVEHDGAGVRLLEDTVSV